MIAGYITTLYVMILLPILIGCAWRACLRVRAGVLECYGIGTVIELALFWVLAYIPIHRGMGVAALSGYVVTASRIAGVVAIVLSLVSFRPQDVTTVRTYGLTDMLLETRYAVKRIFSGKSEKVLALILAAAAIIMLILSVTVIRSDLADRVPETVRMMLRTDCFYGYDPYSGVAYEEPVIPRFATEGWFAVLAYMSGIDSYIFMHRVMAAALIVAGYGVYLSLARRFISLDTKTPVENTDNRSRITCYRIIFLCVVLGLYTLELFHNGPLQFKYFQNIWFDQTLAACIIMPAVIGEILIIMELVISVLTKRKSVKGGSIS